MRTPRKETHPHETNRNMTHKDHWYDDETPINAIVDQAINQKFNYMTVTQITITDDGHVTFEQ